VVGAQLRLEAIANARRPDLHRRKFRSGLLYGCRRRASVGRASASQNVRARDPSLPICALVAGRAGPWEDAARGIPEG